MTGLKRLRALEVLQGWANKVFESGINNHGEMVEMIQRADTLPGEGYAWCMSTQNAAWRLATGGEIVHNPKPNIVGGEMLAHGTASVGVFYEWLSSWGYIVTRPFKGDHVLFAFQSSWPCDHVGMIEKVLGLGPIWYLQTIEGNTGPTGAVSDPGTGKDGIYRKRRLVRASKCAFGRVPGR